MVIAWVFHYSVRNYMIPMLHVHLPPISVFNSCMQFVWSTKKQEQKLLHRKGSSITSRRSLSTVKQMRFSKIYPFRSRMAGLIQVIWYVEQKKKWPISIFLHLPDGSTCRHGENYILFSIFPEVPYSLGNPVMLLLKIPHKSIRLALWMNGNEKSDVVLSVYCLKWRISAAFNIQHVFASV